MSDAPVEFMVFAFKLEGRAEWFGFEFSDGTALGWPDGETPEGFRGVIIEDAEDALRERVVAMGAVPIPRWPGNLPSALGDEGAVEGLRLLLGLGLVEARRDLIEHAIARIETDREMMDRLCEKIRELEAALLPFCEFSPDVVARLHAAKILGIEP